MGRFGNFDCRFRLRHSRIVGKRRISFSVLLGDAAAPAEDEDVSAIAVSFALLGNRDKAFEHLEKAFSNEDDELIFSIRDPALDPLRSDPRYADLMRRLGLPE